jgi:hypothetical protein
MHRAVGVQPPASYAVLLGTYTQHISVLLGTAVVLHGYNAMVHVHGVHSTPRITVRVARTYVLSAHTALRW